MKYMYVILLIFCFISCKEEKEKIKTKKNLEMLELKKDIGLPVFYTDTLSLIAFLRSDSINYDKVFFKIDYKKKLDSLYGVMDEELNIINFDSNFKKDAREALNKLKQSFIEDEKASLIMWSASYGVGYNDYRIDPYAFKRIEQMVSKRRYEELLIYNYHLRYNLTRTGEPSLLYRKRLKDVMPKKVLDSMYPKKIK